jgi:4-amino-4-deoxy-L-arabinose transferase-like glycosyltransferase
LRRLTPAKPTFPHQPGDTFANDTNSGIRKVDLKTRCSIRAFRSRVRRADFHEADWDFGGVGGTAELEFPAPQELCPVHHLNAQGLTPKTTAADMDLPARPCQECTVTAVGCPGASKNRSAARSLVLPDHRLLAPIERVIDALCDPSRRYRTMAGVAIGYALTWTLYAVIAKSTQDIHTDMAEIALWTRDVAAGYPKHPPLIVLLTAVWFALFPLTDWAYYLLAGTMLGLSLYLVFVLSGEWLEGTKRAAVPILVAVIPFYNFLGLKFDHNSAQIPLWAATIWAFMWSLRTCSLGWAALLGAVAAAAVLTKYWAVFLVAALFFAALANRRKSDYFRSAAPWITAGVFALAMLPHTIWLVREGFPPSNYVAATRAAGSLMDWLRSLAEFWGGTLFYASPAMFLAFTLARPSIAAMRDSFLPHDEDRRIAGILFWSPIFLPAVTAAFTGTALVSLWSFPALNLLPVMLLSSPLVIVARQALVRTTLVVIVLTGLALLTSPIVAAVRLKAGVENYAAYSRLIAAVMEREWARVTHKPLRIVAGSFQYVNTVAFYIADRPSTYASFSSYLSPWVNDERIAREGIAVVCGADDTRPMAWGPWNTTCLEAVDNLVKQGLLVQRTELELARHWLWLTGPPQRFVIAVVPPL